MRKNLVFALVVSVVMMLVVVSVANASPGYTNVSWNFGDISGGYGVYNTDPLSPLTPQMCANIELSSGVITSVSMWESPAPWLDTPGQKYFYAQIWFNGNYDSLPTMHNGQGGGGRPITHGGLSITENYYLSSYQDYLPGDLQGFPSGPIWDTASASITMSPFAVTDVQDNFNENTWTEIDPQGVTHTVDEWAYGVTFTGYQPTPEPATLSLIGLGAIAMMRRRRHAAR